MFIIIAIDTPSAWWYNKPNQIQGGAYMEYLETINNWLDEHREELKNDLITLAAVPSVRSAPAPHAPFGEKCAEVLVTASQLFERDGYRCEMYADDGYLLAFKGDDDRKTIGVFGHADVVPPDGEWLLAPPFPPTEMNGYLIGRGVDDNKAGVTASMYAARALAECGIPLKSRLMFFIGTNEESGMADVSAFVRDRKHPTVSITPDSGFPVSVGEKGILRFMVKSDKAFKDILYMGGGNAYNIVLCECRVELKYSDALDAELRKLCGDDTRISIARDGDRIIMNATGISKHASSPDGSLNAASLAASYLSKCESICSGDREIMSFMEHVLSCNYAAGLGLEDVDPNFGRTTFVNGIVDCEDGRIVLGFDVRYGTAFDSKRTEQDVIGYFTSRGWTIARGELNNRPGYMKAEDDIYVKELLRVYREFTGNSEAKTFLMSGGTYSRMVPNAYSVGGQCGGGPGLGLPAGHGGCHQPDESVFIDGVVKAAKIHAQMLIALDRLINN